MLTNNPEAPMTEEKPNVKTTLTKDDQAGWYIFDNRFGVTSCFYWNGDECAGCVGDGFHGDQRDAIGCGMTIIEAINAAEDPYRKITPEPVTNEAARESPGAKGFMECDTCRAKPGTPLLCCGCLTNRTLIAKQSDEIEELKAERDQLHRTREQLQLQQWHGSVVKLAKELGWDDASEQTISEWLRAKLSPPQPEVIEGRGQAVESEVACYMEEWPDGCIQLVRFGPDSIFKSGYRYMRCPTFPPRPAFVAPEKPELVLVRWKATGQLEWMTPAQYTYFASEGCEQIEAGEPLTAGAAK